MWKLRILEHAKMWNRTEEARDNQLNDISLERNASKAIVPLLTKAINLTIKCFCWEKNFKNFVKEKSFSQEKQERRTYPTDFCFLIGIDKLVLNCIGQKVISVSSSSSNKTIQQRFTRPEKCFMIFSRSKLFFARFWRGKYCWDWNKNSVTRKLI